MKGNQFLFAAPLCTLLFCFGCYSGETPVIPLQSKIKILNNHILQPDNPEIHPTAGGSIKGVINPASSNTLIFALQGLDTVAGTSTDTAGSFLINGLNQSSYDLIVIADDTLLEVVSVKNINVLIGQVTNVDTVFLR